MGDFGLVGTGPRHPISRLAWIPLGCVQRRLPRILASLLLAAQICTESAVIHMESGAGRLPSGMRPGTVRGRDVATVPIALALLLVGVYIAQTTQQHTVRRPG